MTELSTDARALIESARGDLSLPPERAGAIKARVEAAIAGGAAGGAIAFGVKSAKGAALVKGIGAVVVAGALAALGSVVLRGDDTPVPRGAVVEAARAESAAADTPVLRSAPSLPAKPSSIAEELKLIRMGTSALARNDFDAARVAIEAHHRRFGTGMLSQEREALSVALQCRTGSGDASALVAAFANKWPGSPQLAQLKGVCTGASK